LFILENSLKEAIKNQIKQILRDCVAGALKRTNKKIATNKAHKPFHIALLTPEIVKVSSFERSFSTSFGQGPIEKISELVARENGFDTQRQKETMINIYKGAVDEVERICSALRSGNQKPNWKKEVQTLSSFTKGDTVVRRIITDLWLKKNDIEYFISIKTVTPNLDQSEISKRDMLLLKAENQNYDTYFGLYYNPQGQYREDYKHSFPMKIFDMHKDKCVLIGKDYWDFLGGPGAYEKLLDVFAEVGIETRETLLDYNR
jgi:hypothetical protein